MKGVSRKQEVSLDNSSKEDYDMISHHDLGSKISKEELQDSYGDYSSYPKQSQERVRRLAKRRSHPTDLLKAH